MKFFRWSRLYPKKWRNEFGSEFDALMEERGCGLSDGFDILVHAAGARIGESRKRMLMAGFWAVTATFNVVAKEVQWTAGALLLFSAIATARNRKQWFWNAVRLFSAVPISTLYLYQRPGGYHEPLYQTSVALIPALIGSAIGYCMTLGDLDQRPGTEA
jgi:hypothetical protein